MRGVEVRDMPCIQRGELGRAVGAIKPAPGCQVVAVVLSSGERLCLLKRSRKVGSDPLLWHCLTGYLPASADPWTQALCEMEDETGLGEEDIRRVWTGPLLRIVAEDGVVWAVYTYLVEVANTSLRLNWENSSYCWIRPAAVETERCVWWLADILSAVGLRSAGLVHGAGYAAPGGASCGDPQSPASSALSSWSDRS